MRDTSSWRRRLTRPLRDRWSLSATGLTPSSLCDIELGLYLLSQLAPDAPAHALWVLLTGYPFPIPYAVDWSEEQQRMLGNARHILSQFRSQYRWERALKRYCQISELELIRGYEVDDALEQFSRRFVSICPDREDIYAATLRQPLRHRRNTVRWATAGSYECADRGYRATVDIPSELVFPPPPRHDLAGRTERGAITVTWDALIETARWMDTLSDDNWEERLSRIRLELFGQDGTALTRAETLTLDGLMHLIGMVSSVDILPR